MRQHATAYAALKAGYHQVCVGSDGPQPQKCTTDCHRTDGICYLVLESVHCTSYIITHYELHVNNKNEMSKECENICA